MSEYLPEARSGSRYGENEDIRVSMPLDGVVRTDCAPASNAMMAIIAALFLSSLRVGSS